MALDLDVPEDGGGDLLDGFGGGIDPPDGFAPHHALGLLDFESAVREFRVVAVGSPLLAYLPQSLGRNRQSVQLGPKALEDFRQRPALEIFGDQRVVGGFHAELHRQVEAGRGFSTARYANENDVRIGEIPVRRTIIVRHREIDRLDSVLVFLLVGRTVRAPDRVVGFDSESRFERVDEGFKEIEHQGSGVPDDIPRFAIYECGKHDRGAVARGKRLPDARHALFLGLCQRVNEWQRDFSDLQALELGEQAVAQHLDRDSGAI